MEFIQNSGPGTRLEKLNETAVQSAESVLAAVAYVTDSRTLLDACWKHKKPLTLFARYDYSGPVSDEVFQWFLSKGTASNYEMRLVADIFHPKVIWWKGVGVYVGSANLSKSAWAGNVEAGIFLTEEDLDDHSMVPNLESFFQQVRSISHTLTPEIAREMVKAGTGPLGQAEATAAFQFAKTRIIPPQQSLVSITRQSAITKHRNAFLKEWSETLQYLRDLGRRASLPENRPVWVPENASIGIVADQFLHAHYYNRVKVGSAFPYRELYEKNSANREATIQDALAWWHTQPSAPTDENIYINEWAPLLGGLLSPGKVHKLTEPEFEELCLRVHAMREHAARMNHKFLGLDQKPDQMSRDERTRLFAKWLYPQRSKDGSRVCEVIAFVLHGGPKAEVPDRIFTACFDEEKKVPHLGVSMLGEMSGWAMPDYFPPRNGRTSKALTALGYQVTIHSA